MDDCARDRYDDRHYDQHASTHRYGDYYGRVQAPAFWKYSFTSALHIIIICFSHNGKCFNQL